uniref:RNA polymerase II C-terminal domain phosphatase-like n=1 Tax=Oryza punctata TaxID=4537 RepID=A0A0E0K6A7_ORYPU
MDPFAAATATDDEEEDHATTGGMEPRQEEYNGASTRGVAGRLLDWRGKKRKTTTTTPPPNDSILLPPEPTSAHLASLLRARKLILILDLDHRFINSTRFVDLSDDEKANGFTKLTGDDHLRGPACSGWSPTGGSPSSGQASAMFEMHVYTPGDRDYAMAVVKLLDPDGVYFGDRIISSDESSRPDRKSLDDVFGSQGQPDRDGEVPRLRLEPQEVRDRGEIPDRAEPGRERAGRRARRGTARPAASPWGFLLRLDRGSFAYDVREVIRQTRREVLRGCTAAFTGVIPSDGRASDHLVWRRAEQLGATCFDDEDDAGTGAAPNPGFAGEKEGDDAEDSGGGSGADDDDAAAAAVSPGAISTDSILLPPEPTSDHLASLLRARKLILVVDLDHTLVNSTAYYDLSGMEYANGLAELITDDPRRGLFILDCDHANWFSALITKLRPFVHDFLREASAMFEMHVYTLGVRDYATAVAKLLDPDGVYFGDRIISSEESPQPDRKSLDVVFGSATERDAVVVILDDTARVWEGHSDNLIEIERYHYFASSCRDFGSAWECTYSLSEREVDESERDGALAAALRVLRRVHAGYFVGGSFEDDVREVIRKTRREVLRGCTVAFTRAIAGDHTVWRRAEQLGATCADDVGPAVTHVVATNPTTFRAVWAQVYGKFLVNPEWINTAHFRWSKPKEEHFPVRC